MKKLSLGLAVLMVFAPPLSAAEGFVGGLTREEAAAAGLEKLTPGETARLEALVQRYKAGEVAAAQQASAKEERRKGYLALLFGRDAAKEFSIESTLPGNFRLFDGRPLFTLENGQQWKTTETVQYHCPKPLQNPRVVITQGAFNSFWLKIEGGPRVRVQPVRME